MASTDCGWCGRLVYLEAVSPLLVVRPPEGLLVTQAAYKCPNCGRLVTVWEYGGSSTEQWNEDVAQDWEWSLPQYVPDHRESKEYPDVPDHIGRAASEATLCLSAGAYRAVGALARAVIEATAKDKGAEGKALYERIEALADAGHVRKHTKEQAHEVRHFGNGMAHGDFTEPVTKEDAEEIITLMSEVLDEVYQSPARLASVKAAREAKKARSASAGEEPGATLVL